MVKSRTVNIFFFCSCLMFLPFYSIGQVFQEIIGGYSGTIMDEGRSIQQTFDGGYIMTGRTALGVGGSCGFGACHDVYLVKTDGNGDVLWTKTYGGAGDDWGMSVDETLDSGYIITGWTESFGAGQQDVYLIKTDINGDTMWTKTYGGVENDYAKSVEQTPDSGYVIVGATNSYGAGGICFLDPCHDVYVIKTNVLGDTLWTKTFGLVGVDIGEAGTRTVDGGYIITGMAYGLGFGAYDVYLIKIDVNGNLVWAKLYGGSLNDWGYQVRETDDKGFVIIGETESFGAGDRDLYLIRTDGVGSLMWSKTYGGIGVDAGYSVQETTDMGYILAAITESFGGGSYDAYLIKTDTLGDTLWTKTYGGTDFEAGYSVQQTNDGGYVMAGVSGSFGVGSADNLYLIKTDASGNTYCDQYATATIVGKPVTSQTSVTGPILVGAGAITNSTAAAVSDPADSSMILCIVMPALSTSINGTNLVCFQDSTGTADLTVTGGTAPYSYFWAPNGQTTEDITGLSAGTYYVTVTDSLGNAVYDSITISEPAELIVIATTTDVTCNGNADGTALLAVSGGTAPYTINWGTADTNALAAGTYTYTVTDANSCTLTDSVSITESSALEATATNTDASCNGDTDGSIDLTVTGGTSPYNYSWSTIDTIEDLSGLAAGTYTVTVSDNNSCSDSATVVVTEPAQVVTSVITGNIQVYINSIENYSVVQTTGSSYTWSATGGTISSGQGTSLVSMLWSNTPGNGILAVVEMDEDSCFGDTVYLTVIINDEIIGIDFKLRPEELLIYPNPFCQSSVVKFRNEEKVSFKLILYDMVGNKVRVIDNISSNEVLVEKGKLMPGEYFIELKSMVKSYKGRIMVE